MWRSQIYVSPGNCEVSERIPPIGTRDMEKWYTNIDFSPGPDFGFFLSFDVKLLLLFLGNEHRGGALKGFGGDEKKER